MPDNALGQRGVLASAEAEPQPALKTCPVCGSTSRADSTTCYRCLSDLRRVAMLAPRAVTEWLESERARALNAQRARRRRRLLRAAAVVLLAALFYLGFIRDVPPTPLPSSSTRAVGAGAQAWPAPAGDVVWSRNLGSPIVGAVAVGEDIVYASLADARVVALSADDGRELWTLTVPGQLDSAPAIAGDRLYLGLRDGRVMAVTADTGAELWSTDTVQGVHTSPVVADGIVWVIARAQVLALDAEDGTLLWEQEFRSPGAAVGPVVAEDRIVVSTGQQILVFNRENGAQTSFFRLQGIKHIATEEGTVMALSPNLLLSIEAHAGRPWWDGFRRIWRGLALLSLAPAPPAPPHNWLLAPPSDAFALVVDSGQVVLASPDGVVRAYGLRGGEARWEQSIEAIASGPVLTRDGLLIPHLQALTLLDPATGEERWLRPLEGLELRALTVGPRGSYVVTESDELFALR